MLELTFLFQFQYIRVGNAIRDGRKSLSPRFELLRGQGFGFFGSWLLAAAPPLFDGGEGGLGLGQRGGDYCQRHGELEEFELSRSLGSFILSAAAAATVAVSIGRELGGDRGANLELG